MDEQDRGYAEGYMSNPSAKGVIIVAGLAIWFAAVLFSSDLIVCLAPLPILGAILLIYGAKNLNTIRAFNPIRLGTVQHQKGDFESAIAHFNEAIALSPGFAGAYISRAHAHLDRGAYDLAINDAHKAIQLAPHRYSTAYSIRAEAFYNIDEYDNALRDATEGARIFPHEARNHVLRGMIYLATRKIDKAIETFLFASRLKPQSTIIISNLGTAYFANNQFDVALAEYEKAIRLDPKLAIAFNNRGYLYSVIGQYAKALGDSDAAIRLDPGLHLAYGTRGHTHFLTGHFEEALEDFNKAVELKPDHKFAIAGQAISLYRLDKPDEAVTIWKALIERDTKYKDATAIRDEYYCAPPLVEVAEKIISLSSQPEK